jgi:hypothetical protein
MSQPPCFFLVAFKLLKSCYLGSSRFLLSLVTLSTLLVSYASLFVFSGNTLVFFALSALLVSSESFVFR